MPPNLSIRFPGKSAELLHFVKLSQPATLLKEKLQHRCFPVNFAKFLRTTVLENKSGSWFWYTAYLISQYLSYNELLWQLTLLHTTGLFLTPWNHQKTRGFMFSAGIERDHWHETGSIGFRCWKLIFLQKGQLTEVTGLTKHLFSVKNEEWKL